METVFILKMHIFEVKQVFGLSYTFPCNAVSLSEM